MPSVETNGSNGDSSYKFFNVIDGKPRPSKDHHQVIDPRTEEPLWDAPIATPQDLDDAVAAATRAFKTWKNSTTAERQKAVHEVAEVILKNVDILAEVQMRETGKSKTMSKFDVERAAWHFEYYRNVTLEDELQYEDDTVQIYSTHQPIGILGAISPWNFPMILSVIKVVSALATGNCVIIKPSPFTPYSLLKFCELAQSVLPPGVFQVLNGGAELGEQMTLHPGIHHISFTGTIAVGQRILQNCTKTLKKVILELAGNNACIVCEDVDLAKVVPLVASGALFHAGQVCVASKRIYVHESLYDRFLDMLVEESKKYVVDDDENSPAFSPLSNKVNYDRAVGIVEDCKKNGYKIVTGGDVKPTGKGYWITPTIVSKPPEDSLIVREEQFAPIVPVLSWTSEADVIARANLDNAGLGASVYTPDLARARKIAAQLESGTVWINQFERPHHAGFFGGWKLSGYGGELGKEGLLHYSQIKTLQIAK
ncbi:aldehyde dehydrogenase [Hypoxylon fragiforme]|uniref:aldehyde dehydrogenase n=1 Tax=Hypoxylon fragiforme TaxID=63214 RepID=UPI0020C67D28|nr:aldehyde dehydrogenase [Hypoxylon fragiforme]KAI2611230.1 aldehyde dehydrogenase [Hypoxylon fragiforme]